MKTQIGSTVFAIAAMGLSGSAAFAGGGVDVQPEMGAPLNGLTADEMTRFLLGRDQYNRVLLPEEGLGPIFNDNSCGTCHNTPTGGPGTATVTRFGAQNKGGFDDLAQFGGSLLQANAIDDACLETVHESATIESLRVTNGMMGYGLVEAIDDADIIAVQAAQDPSVQGVLHMVGAFEDPDGSPLRVGRFGHKAQVATVLTFSADAALNELGLTNRFIEVENDPNGILPPDLIDCDFVADPEDADGFGGGGVDFIDRVTDFQRFLAAPPQTPRSQMSGEDVFNLIGCAQCHHPSYTTPDDARLEDSIRNQEVRPYSDFLLHDMGLTSDFIGQGATAVPGMVKTPPLMGLRMRPAMWHDARFDSGGFGQMVNDAIAAHDALLSQGAPSAQAYALLPQEDKDALVAFLDSLGRREFDTDGDNTVGIEDFVAFAQCFTEGGVYDADDPCAISDIDQDGDRDLTDFDGFLMSYEGYAGDCNENGILDLLDILNGTSLDANMDGTPDECEPTCNGDIDGTGAVNVGDLLDVLGQFGGCPDLPAPCSADVNFDGQVNVLDLLFILQHWGACP